MFVDTEDELNIVTDNLTNFAKALVEFIEKIIAFFNEFFGEKEEA